jgi:hypothetical protein
MHKVADLPHQRLVFVDDRLGSRTIFIEPRSGHPLLEIPDGIFGRGDLRFEGVDFRAPGLLGAGLPARFGVGAFPFFAARIGSGSLFCGR